jgi:hypothetical protein
MATQVTLNSGSVDSAGSLALKTNGTTTAVTVDTSQNVGIGTASPTQLLTLSNGATPRLSVKDTRASVEMQVLADNVAGYSGTVTNYPYIFVTNNAERARFNAGAPILCLSGGSTTATGTGIAFPATQSASSNVNTLDDYEEGTFTILLQGSASNPTYTATSSTGKYTKIGNLVTVVGYLGANTISGGSGNLRFGGFPFAAALPFISWSSFALGYKASGAAVTPAAMMIADSNTYAEFWITASSTNPQSQVTTSFALASLGGSVDFYFTGSYQTST